MTRRLPLVLALAALVACGDDDPTGIDDLGDVAGESFDLVGIGKIYGFREGVPGYLQTGPCPARPGLVEETHYQEGALSFTDDGYLIELRVRTSCYDPYAEVIVPEWGPVTTERMEGGYTLEGDRLLLDSPASHNVYAYLENGGLRVEFEPATGMVDTGNVLIFR